MLPAEGGDVRKEVVRNDLTPAAERVGSPGEIDGVPQDDGGSDEVEAGGAVALVLESTIAQLAETVEEHGPFEGVVRLALVQTAVAAAAEGGILEPIEREEGALDPAELAQRLGEAVLARVGGELLQHDRGGDRAELDGCGQAQELVPALLHEVDLDRAGDERFQAPVVGGPLQDVEAPVGEVA